MISYFFLFRDFRRQRLSRDENWGQRHSASLHHDKWFDSNTDTQLSYVLYIHGKNLSLFIRASIFLFYFISLNRSSSLPRPVVPLSLHVQ